MYNPAAINILLSKITEIGNNSGTKVGILSIHVGPHETKTIKCLRAISEHTIQLGDTNIVQSREAIIYKAEQQIDKSNKDEIKKHNQYVQQQREKIKQTTEIIIANLPLTISNDTTVILGNN